MLNMPATLIGAMGTAFLAASFAPGMVSDHSFARPSSSGLQETVLRAAKGDRIVPPGIQPMGATVSIVNLVGGTHVWRITGPGDGDVLFGPDPLATSSRFVDPASPPAPGIRDGHREPLPQPPTARDQSKDQPRRRKPLTFGCVASVSPLAQAYADQVPSLCLASLDRNDVPPKGRGHV